MKGKLTLLVIMIFLFWSCVTNNPFLTKDKRIIIKNANVIPVDREVILYDQTVVIENGIILSIGADTKITSGQDTRMIDGTGCFLIPGLSDMHVHINNKNHRNGPPCKSAGKRACAL